MKNHYCFHDLQFAIQFHVHVSIATLRNRSHEPPLNIILDVPFQGSQRHGIARGQSLVIGQNMCDRFFSSMNASYPGFSFSQPSAFAASNHHISNQVLEVFSWYLICPLLAPAIGSYAKLIAFSWRSNKNLKWSKCLSYFELTLPISGLFLTPSISESASSFGALAFSSPQFTVFLAVGNF